MALQQVDQHREVFGVRPVTVGADKLYHQRAFVQGCRSRGLRPHVAIKDNIVVPGVDGRTTTRSGYQTSQRIRKRIEEIFGWIKTVGVLRKTRYRGTEKISWYFTLAVAAYDLVRMRNLGLGAA